MFEKVSILYFKYLRKAIPIKPVTINVDVEIFK